MTADPGGEEPSPPGHLKAVEIWHEGYLPVRETGLYYLQSRYYNPTWGRFLNADVFVATGQGLLGNNMFTYCGSNPITREEFKGQYWIYSMDEYTTEEVESGKGQTTYQTTITYVKRWQPLLGCSIEYSDVAYRYEVTFEYTVTSNGVVKFDNNQSSASHLNVSCVRDVLAQEMISSAQSRVSGSLEYRTVSGISAELHMHYVAHKLFSSTIQINVLAKSAAVADMGSANKGGVGPDSNAGLFEFLFGWLDAIFNRG